MSSNFREVLKAGTVLLGTFIKTPTVHATEILGGAGFEFIVVDEEHAPIDRAATDNMMLACKASGIVGLVRVCEPTPAQILSVLDSGAAGVLVPHVASVERAKAIASAGRYRGGSRGFSNSPRAGGYGVRSLVDHAAASDASVCMIAMIEDAEALEVIDDILEVDGIHAIFVGRGDLTVALGASRPADAVVQEAVDRILEAARRHEVPVMMMVGSLAEAKEFRAKGVNAFIVSSDQGLMRQAAQKTRTEFDTLKS